MNKQQLTLKHSTSKRIFQEAEVRNSATFNSCRSYFSNSAFLKNKGDGSPPPGGTIRVVYSKIIKFCLPLVCVCVLCQLQLLHSLCNPLSQLATGGVRVSGEYDQATFGVVHVSGFFAAALPTLRQWIPGHPRCAKTFLQWRRRSIYFLRQLSKPK